MTVFWILVGIFALLACFKVREQIRRLERDRVIASKSKLPEPRVPHVYVTRGLTRGKLEIRPPPVTEEGRSRTLRERWRRRRALGGWLP